METIKKTSNRKLTQEERSKLMSSPTLEGSDNLMELPNEQENVIQKTTISFEPEDTVIEEKTDSENTGITGSVLFKTLANFLQTQQINKPLESENENNLIQSDEPDYTSEQVIDNILLNLEILSRIKEHDKLSNQDKILEIDTRLGQFFRRWFSGDSRGNTLSRIEDIANLTIQITNHLLEAEYDDSNKTFNEKETLLRSFETNKSQYFIKFSKNMTDAIQGLNNLKKTYEYDEAIKSRIDMVIDKLTCRLGKITEKLAIKTK
jgi:hypothetical protein